MKTWIVQQDALILVTGAGGFIGKRLVRRLLDLGFTRLRCLVRHQRLVPELISALGLAPEDPRVEGFVGNLLSKQDCAQMCRGVELVYHLAAGRGEKAFADAFLNSVVTTRNLLEALRGEGRVARFVNVSSFAVYTNRNKSPRNLLDERCPVEAQPHLRGNAYSYAKAKQDELVVGLCGQHRMPYTIVRPGVVYGPGNEPIHSRVGIGTFGVFLHLGGWNPVPLTYVDNCADIIALAGLVPGVEGQVFNAVDDDLPSSRQFLCLYKRQVRNFRSIRLPKCASYLFCYVWEKYSAWSEGQLPNAYNRRLWHAAWKRTRYSNARAKTGLGWVQRVATEEGMKRYFESCRKQVPHD